MTATIPATELAWLKSELGSTESDTDLAIRYERLGTAPAVAVEILKERRAKILASPMKLTVNNVATVDNTSNLAALDRRISYLLVNGGDETGAGDPEMPTVRTQRLTRGLGR